MLYNVSLLCSYYMITYYTLYYYIVAVEVVDIAVVLVDNSVVDALLFLTQNISYPALYTIIYNRC